MVFPSTLKHCKKTLTSTLILMKGTSSPLKCEKKKGHRPLEQKEESSIYKIYKYSLNNPCKGFKIFILLPYILSIYHTRSKNKYFCS